MKTTRLLRLMCAWAALFMPMLLNAVYGQWYYEYSYTYNISIEPGEKVTLDPTKLPGDAGTYFSWYRSHTALSKYPGMSGWSDSYFNSEEKEILDVTNKYKVLTPTGQGGNYVDSYKCDVIGLKPGKCTIAAIWRVESRKYSYSTGKTTDYVDVRCDYNVTVKATNDPQLTITANYPGERILKDTRVTLTPSVSGATIYYESRINGKLTSSFWDGTFPTTGMVITERTSLEARAIKRGYPASDLFKIDYEVIEPGDFHVTLSNGVDTHFKVLSESNKTCSVYYVPSTIAGEMEIPSLINGYSVVAIGDSAFYECNELTSVTIPESVKAIGRYAFYGCEKLDSVNIPNGVTTIEPQVFSACRNLKNVGIPNSVKSIGNRSFAGSGLNAFSIPEGFETIADYALYRCDSLKEIVFPSSVSSIGKSSFRGCENLASVTAHMVTPCPLPDNAFIGVSSTSDWTSATLYVPRGSKEKYKSTGGWLRFKEIEEIDFTPDLTDTGDVNGDGAVNGTDLVALASIVLGKQAETKAADVNGDGAVNGTDIVALANLILGRSASMPKKIRVQADAKEPAKLSIEDFEIEPGEAKEMIIDLTNPNDELTLVQFDLHLPAGLSIGEVDGELDIDMCERTTWRKHTLDANQLENDAYRFLLYSSSNAPISGTEGGIIKLKLVADDSFTGGIIKLDNSLLVSPKQEETKPDVYEYQVGKSEPTPTPDTAYLSIEDFAISSGSESVMTINLANPDDVLTLVQFDLHLPAGLSIKEVDGELDIDMCERTMWRKHTLDANLMENDAYRFLLYSSGNAEISGTSGGIIKIKLTADTSFESGTIVIDNILLVSPDQKEIRPGTCEYTLEGVSGDWKVGDVFIAKTVEGVDMKFRVTNVAESTCSVGGELDYYGFSEEAIDYNYKGKITIPSTAKGFRVTSISAGAFGEHDESECQVTSVEIPEGVIEIGLAAFEWCQNLETVDMPNSVAVIGNCAFNGCISLRDIKLPNGITNIDLSTFRDCKSLTSIEIPNSVKSIGWEAFAYSGLTSVKIPNSVTSIEDGAFNCENLISVETRIKEPFAINANTFANYDATLYVPAGTKARYKEMDGWKNFRKITEMEDNRCAMPSISFYDGKLTFSSDTEGAEFVYEIADDDIGIGHDKEVALTATYNISVYATKKGYENSDIATATLCWIEQTPHSEGITNVEVEVPSQAVMIQSAGGVLSVHGATDGTKVEVYKTNGIQIGSAISQYGVAQIRTDIRGVATVIVKIGDRTVKTIVR